MYRLCFGFLFNATLYVQVVRGRAHLHVGPRDVYTLSGSVESTRPGAEWQVQEVSVDMNGSRVAEGRGLAVAVAVTLAKEDGQNVLGEFTSVRFFFRMF